jgi:hypothetical protein
LHAIISDLITRVRNLSQAPTEMREYGIVDVARLNRAPLLEFDDYRPLSTVLVMPGY